MGADLGQRLRAVREERGLSQDDLARDLIPASELALIETGRLVPDIVLIDQLASRLGCAPEYLETGLGDEVITEQRRQLEFAEIAYANGAVRQSCDLFREVYVTAAGRIRHEAALGLARAEEDRGDLRGALEYITALLAAARDGEAGTPGVPVLLMHQCRLYRLDGDLARSIEVGQAGLREVRDLGLEVTEDGIRLASTLVSSYWSRDDMTAAQELAGQVIDLAESLGSRAAQGSAYWNACLVAEASGDLEQAITLARRALALLGESGSDLSLAGLRVTCGWLLLRREPPELDEAEDLLERAHETLADLSATAELGSCETELARIALLRGDFDLAIETAGQAMSRCSDAGAELEYAGVISGVAMVMTGQVNEGFATAAAAAIRLADMGSRQDAARAWREIAEAMARQGRTESALTALRQADECAAADQQSA
ncbi:MAG TPA: helix-turn-helix domain-containing protein [Streptosporangiaceae bacterium]|jgi:tetratricopeptide (TPR) repeat protein|nr:helix-turn-helix domain-containing protein [Streptosporangiaceae bacterium]